jgi:hypothetical protein
VAKTLLEEIENVLIVERVVDAPAFAARTDDAHTAHQPKLMRNRRLANPDVVGNLVDAELPGRQGVDDADPRGIAEDAERIGEGLDQGVGAAKGGG